jgi:hypothetical protein
MRARRGANAIEFAFLVPVFLSIFTGMAEFGFYHARDAALRHAVYRAVRAGAGTAMADDPEARFQSELEDEMTASAFDSTNADIDVDIEGGAGDRFLVVTVTLPWDGLTGWVPHPHTMSATLRARMEDQEPET